MLSALRRRFAYGTPNIKAASLRQISELDQPTDIITHPPTVATQFPFHLDAFLFDTPPDPVAALKCHENFQIALAQISGAKVWSIYEILEKLTPKELRSLLMQTCEISFKIDTDVPIDPITEKISSEYIDYSLSRLSKHDLLDLILLHPSIKINVDNSSTGFSYQTIPVSPLSNMIFTRDQQIATSNGVVMARFNAPQRTTEVSLMSQVLPLIGVKPIGQIQEPGHLEGGDFFPLGAELSMLGVGLRTTEDAARQLRNLDLLGTKKFVVVEDSYDLCQARAHLDTVFNVVDDHTCVCLDATADDSGKYLRGARIYTKKGASYVEEEVTTFGKFLEKMGYNVIKCSMEQQANHFTNFINLGRDSHGRARILTSNPELEGALRKAGAEADVFDMDFSAITAMSGGPRSSSFILRREY